MSQAAIGAGFAMCLAPRNKLRVAASVGALAGMAPDLDVLIRSSTDPLLAIEYHRHFTHSLLIAPVIGFFVGTVCWLVMSRLGKGQSLDLKSFLLFGATGTFTHGLLDACTSYGTQLFWPFSNARIAWNNVAIIDPIPTLTLLIAVGVSSARKNKAVARAGTLLFVLYLGLGVVQRERASALQTLLTQSRGHFPKRETVKPTIFNQIVFRSIYEFEGKYYLDALRVPLFGKPSYVSGDRVEVFDFKSALESMDSRTPQKHDLERWAWFSNEYLTKTADGLLSDVRYSMLPASSSPMWGIRLRPDASNEHVEYWIGRNLDPELRAGFFDFLFYGQGGEFLESFSSN